MDRNTIQSILRGRSARILSLICVGMVFALVLSSAGIDGTADRTPAAEVHVTDEAVSLESEPFTDPVDIYTMSDEKDERLRIARNDSGIEITVESPPVNQSAFEDKPAISNETHVQEIVRTNETVQSLIANSSEYDISTRVALDLSYREGEEPRSAESDQTAFEVTASSENEIRIRQTTPPNLDTTTATVVLQEEGQQTTYSVAVDAVNETVTDITATTSENDGARGTGSG